MGWMMPYSPRGGSVLLLEIWGLCSQAQATWLSCTPLRSGLRPPRALGSQPSAREREGGTWVSSPWPLTAQTQFNLSQWVPDIKQS